jgi:hypothetical protein
MSELADIEKKFQFGPVAKFDFDIRNYDVNDMMNILNISGDPNKLNQFNVREKTDGIIDKLKQDGNLSSEMRNKFESFIRALEFFLIYKYNVKADNYVMDKTLLNPNKMIADVAVRNKNGSIGGGGGGGSDMISINTYRRNIIPRLLSFDTKFRPNYFSSSSTNFSMVLSTPLKNVISMRLISFEFPNVVYDIDATLGTNILTITDHEGDVCKFELPSGNYHSDTVCNALNNINGNVILNLDGNPGAGVNTAIEDAAYQAANPDREKIFDEFSFHIDTKTGRTIITSKSKKKFKLDFTNTLLPSMPITKNLGWKLGFRQLKYQGLYSYVSEAPVDLGGQKVLFFCVDDYRTNVTENVSIVYQNSFMNRNILARIPLRQGKFVTCYDDNSDMIRKKRDYFGPVTIDKLHFRLLDEYGIDVRLNYSDYSFGLEFEILYEK